VREERFSAGVSGGVLHGHRRRAGLPALLLHGGPGIPDYTASLADELDGLFASVRYTQRGTPPSVCEPPYSIESHVADAIRVLDALQLDRAWAIGHSWGAHLGLHLLVAHPDRLLGFVGVGALGAYAPFAEVEANLRRGLSDAELTRLDGIAERRLRGVATEAEALERWALIWPQFFAAPTTTPPPDRAGVECSRATNASIRAHLEDETLVRELARVRLPCLFVHGELDPIPIESARETGALIPGAHVAGIERCGHFPWLERPGEARRAIDRWMSDI